MILPGIVASTIILTILFLTHKLIEKSTKDKWWIYSSIIFNVTVYSFAGTYAANCTFDNSKPKIFETEVLDKSIHNGSKGRKSYYIKVAPWGHHLDKEEINVSYSEYEEIFIGEKIKIDLKEGLFNIPWYYIERKKD